MFIVLFAMLSFTQQASGQIKKLYPVDEAAKDPTFFVFRARLLRAIHEKDATFIYSILDEKIMNSFGGDGGIPEFKTTWHAERRNSPLWKELLTVLALGGKFDETSHSFFAPYVFSSFPETPDTYESAAVIEDGVRVRRGPGTSNEVISTLSFDIVEVQNWESKKSSTDKREWVQIKLTDNQTGYIAAEYLRSPIDYRAIFEKKKGKWLMTSFIAGD
jgi:hypothetical protein